ncbi:TetR/AcrR family transcriptional regulator [Shewanella surugensis]|uniref:TetR/AcrR family transcriptional regulator n=1 Tax=Shewanella surugensis TaxID=212020 RepID=A0ABT0LBI1_9GAMM|nr:TetR/AcrR family transcriptional regulator [Shewanella surugensis]MCL1125057.1 TetR/AcrR family transcriptional regulator [Shewanella surugensis]
MASTSLQSQNLTKREQKHASILAAANVLFCEQGFPHTSMDEIAKKAGVSKQTLYSHFGCKNTLFAASISAKADSYQLNSDVFSDPDEPEKTLTYFAEQFGRLMVSEEALAIYQTCVTHADRHPEIAQVFFENGPECILSLLSDYLKKVAEKGDYQFDVPRHCAVRLCLMLFGEMRLKLDLGINVDDLVVSRDRYIQSSVDMFLRAYRIRGHE